MGEGDGSTAQAAVKIVKIRHKNKKPGTVFPKTQQTCF
jgi:hypothetical protein